MGLDYLLRTIVRRQHPGRSVLSAYMGALCRQHRAATRFLPESPNLRARACLAGILALLRMAAEQTSRSTGLPARLGCIRIQRLHAPAIAARGLDRRVHVVSTWLLGNRS